MMKNTIVILLLSAIPALVLADGGHGAMHAMPEHGMGAMQGVGNSPTEISLTGKPGDPARIGRTIEVRMNDDMRFTPNSVTVKAGEVVRFFVRNVGRTPHELVIGSMEALKAHAAMMRDMPGMEHAEPNMVTLNPGQRGGLVWQFDQPGTVDFACLIPGHMEAGMVGKVTVAE